MGSQGGGVGGSYSYWLLTSILANCIFVGAHAWFSRGAKYFRNNTDKRLGQSQSSETIHNTFKFAGMMVYMYLLYDAYILYVHLHAILHKQTYHYNPSAKRYIMFIHMQNLRAYKLEINPSNIKAPCIHVLKHCINMSYHRSGKFRC